jgi:hypothetical protein
MTTPPRWRKSTHSQTQTACIELPHTLDAVRDSKRRDGPLLRARELPTLIRQIKAGQFDR